MSQTTFTPSTASQQILEQLSVAVFLLTPDCQIRFCNQSAAMLIGQSKKKLQGQCLWHFLLEHTFPMLLLEQLWDCGRSFSDNDVEMIFPDGRHLITEVTADQATLDGQTFCLLQIRHNDNLRKINLENTQKHHISASRHLIRGLAHEIKNPLGGIRGAAQLLSRNLNSQELQEFTQLIIEQSDRLRDLVDRLLGPNTLPKRVEANIHSVVERVFNLVNLDKPAELAIVRDYDPSLPSTVMDPNMMEQVVLNIVKNAVQALEEHLAHQGPEFKPELVLRTRFAGSKVINEQRHRQVLELSILDNGPGISDELKDTLFYPLVTNKPEGNGLGLSIAQTLVDQHKGTIEVESWPGHTAFRIYLPVIPI